MKRLLLLLACLSGLALLGESRASWGTGGCGPSAGTTSAPVGVNIFAPANQARAPFTGWAVSDKSPPWVNYWVSDQLQETWNPQTGERHLWRNQGWVPVVTATKERPKEVAVKEEVSGPSSKEYNGGINVEELAKERPQYTVNVNGKETVISKKEALGLVTSPDSDKVPSDKDRPWLIAVGDQDFLKRFSADLERSAIKAKVRYQGYSADSFVVKKYNLDDHPAYQKSKTAVLISLASGDVVHGQFEYKAGDLEVIGQKFDPTKLPDLRIPERVGEGMVDMLIKKIKEEPVIWVGGAIVLILLFRKENK